MAGWITLGQAVELGIVKKGSYIDYHPEKKTTVFDRRETGWRDRQVWQTEDLRYMFAHLSQRGEIVIVSDTITDQSLHLQGEIGKNQAINTLQKVCNSLFSNNELGAVAYFMTKEDFEELPRKVRKVRNREKIFCDSVFGPGATCTNYLNEEYIIYSHMILKVRPLVTLEPTIFIRVEDNLYDGSSSEKAFQISLNGYKFSYLENILLP